MTAAERQAVRMGRIRRKVADAVNTVQQLGESQVDHVAEIWNRRRLEIRQWLETQAPPLAGVYQEIVTLIHMPESAARLHFVAHGIREIGNRLPGYLDEITSEQVNYRALVKPICSSWEQAGLPLGDNLFPVPIESVDVPGENQVKIPFEVARQIAALLGEHAEGVARNRKKTTILFDALRKASGATTSGAAQFAIKRWDFIREWAVENAHVGNQGPKSTHAELIARFNDFERILFALVARFLDVLGEVDGMLTTAPSPDTIDAFIALLSRGGVRNYFFERVKDPGWLQALDEKGYFDDLLEGDHWPESAFLIRMAAHDPERVTGILERLTVKPNRIVGFYLVDIAVALPPLHAARLDEPLAKMAGGKNRPFNLWHNLPKVIVHLANGGQSRAAFKLFDAMYSVRRTKSADSVDEVSFPDTASDLWLFQEGLKIILPALATVNAKMLIQALCSKLNAAVEAQGYLGPDGLDCSNITGRNLSAAEDEWPAAEIIHDPGSMFATTIVRVAKMAIRSGFIDADDAVTLIERKRGKIFGCVSFYLLASVAPDASGKAIERMANVTEFGEGDFEGPYGRLLQARFAELSVEQRTAVIDWVRQGPDLANVVSRWERMHGVKPTVEQLESYKKVWIRERLNWIPTELLPADDAALLEKIEGGFDHEQRPWSVFGVEASPKTQEELRAMSATEIADFLKANPPGSGRGPASELASILPQIMQERTSEFSAAAEAYIGVHQSWIRSLIWGLDTQAKQGTEIQWDSVLALCAWVVDQPRGEEPRDVIGNGDVSWEGARGAVADVLRAGLQNTKATIPPALGPMVWGILEKLAEDPDPTVEYERGRAFEAAMLAINSVRGKTIHSVIQYAIWRRQRMNDQGESGGFEAMPEVQELLDAHLDLERDPSPAVRSVYAQYFPALVYLDAGWAAGVAQLLFPDANDDLYLWRAAWSVYATYARPFDQVFDILRPTYELAVQRMPWGQNTGAPKSQDPEDWRHAEENVACHLLAFYWRGKVQLEEGDLLVRFLNRAVPKSRSKAMWFVANSLASHEGDVPADVQEKMKALWEWRMKVARESTDPADREELASFGGWFAYGKLDPEWSARKLAEVLKLTDHVDHPGMVVGRLAAIAPTDMKCAIDGLDAFVTADREGWRHTMAMEHVEAILRIGLESELPGVAKTARGIVGKLAERGDLSYRALLNDRGVDGQ